MKLFLNINNLCILKTIQNFFYKYFISLIIYYNINMGVLLTKKMKPSEYSKMCVV